MERKPQKTMFKPKDKVRVKRDLYRWSFEEYKKSGITEEKLYAKAGESGEILEIFYPSNSSAMAPKIPHAKVLIENQIKTFRLSSIEKL